MRLKLDQVKLEAEKNKLIKLGKFQIIFQSLIIKKVGQKVQTHVQ